MADNDFTKISGYKLIAIDDPPDFRDRAYRPSLGRLPDKLDPPAKLRVLDQGQEGACTGFGLAAVINHFNRERKRDYAVSTRMLYEMARKFDEWPGEKYEGSSCRGAIKGWYAMGVCREKDWAYDPNKRGELTVDRAKAARENTLGAYYRVQPKVSDFHAALNETAALFVSAKVHTGWRPGSCKNGRIPYPRKELGGHAFAIVGYNEDGFWVQNSWGPNWGDGGKALWTYEDWQANIRDAWVFRMAVPSLPIWHLPPNKHSSRLGDPDQSGRSPHRAEIAGHFVHIDDGNFDDHGRYWSNLADVRQTAKLLSESRKYRHLLLYAHGGLNSTKASARRISVMKEVFKANGIYPYHFMYDTGLMEEIKDVVLGKKDAAAERVGGFTDFTDRLLERATRKPGRALWREMKSGARLPFDERRDGSRVVDAMLGAVAGNGFLKQIHLVGHSTGGILMAYLLAAIERRTPDLRVSTCSLLAPASTIDLFKTHYYPHLAAGKSTFGVDQMTVYNLSARLEKDDQVAGAYRKSLLYLVSRAFEENTPSPLLGMKIHADQLKTGLPKKRLEFCYSEGKKKDGSRTAAKTHGGFDNDVRTMNDILRRVTGNDEPKRPFTRDDLDY